jgi:hypothetical protein
MLGVAIVLGIAIPARAQVFERPDFFEQGREQFEREIYRINHPDPDPALEVTQQNDDWQEFVSDRGQFAISLPETAEEETIDIDLDAGTISLTGYSVGERFAVAYWNAPETAAPEVFLDQMRDRLIAYVGGELLESEMSEDMGCHVRTFTLSSRDTIVDFNLYWIGNRLYILGASYDDADNRPADVSRFFNSFEATDDSCE